MKRKQTNLFSVLKTLRTRLSQAFHQDVPLILFGSQARGEATPDSDVDVLAILPDLSPNSLSLALDIAWEIAFENGLVISIIPATQNEIEQMNASPFFQSVKREGILI